MAAMLPLAGGAVVGTIAWRWLVEGSGVAACVLSVVAAVLVYVGVFGLAMPYLGTINVSGRLLAASERARTAVPSRNSATAGYPEESLAFLNPIKTQILDGAGAANFLNRGGCRLVVVEGRQLSSFRQRAKDLGLDIDVRGRGSGFRPWQRPLAHPWPLCGEAGTGISVDLPTSARASRGERLVEVGDEIVRVLEADVKADQRPRRLP